MTRTITTLFIATLIGCGSLPENQTHSTDKTTCTYEPVGYCEVVDADSVLWYIWESDVRLNEGDRDLLRRVNVMTCAECGRQSDVFACEKHNIEVNCDEIPE